MLEFKAINSKEIVAMFNFSYQIDINGSHLRECFKLYGGLFL